MKEQVIKIINEELKRFLTTSYLEEQEFCEYPEQVDNIRTTRKIVEEFRDNILTNIYEAI